MQFLTQFHYESVWTKVSKEEVIRLIKEEFPDVPPEGIYAHVEEECKKGKTVSVGECRFKEDKTS